MVNVIEVTADERVIDITVASYADLYASATAASVSADAAAASELAAGLSEVNAGASETASAASAVASDASAVASAASAAAALIDADRAEVARDEAVLYGGVEIVEFSDLATVTAVQVAVGGVVYERTLGQTFIRAPDAANDAKYDYSGGVGVKWYGQSDVKAPISILFIGQSNMIGNIDAVGGDLTMPDGSLIWNSVGTAGADIDGTQFIRPRIGTFPFNRFSTTFGSYATTIPMCVLREMQQRSDRPVYSITVAAIGHAVEAFIPEATRIANGWTVPGGNTDLAEHLFTNSANMLAAIPQGSGSFDYVFFHQGEQNFGAGDTVREYRDKVTALFDDLVDAGHVDANKTRIVFGAISRLNSKYMEHKGALGNRINRFYAHVGMADSAGLPMQADNVHFTAEGYEAMARRMIDAAHSRKFENSQSDDYATIDIEIADAETGGNTATFTAGTTQSMSRCGRNIMLRIDVSNIDTTGMTPGNALYVRGLRFRTYPNMPCEGVVRWTKIVTAGTHITAFMGSAKTAMFFFKNGDDTNGVTLKVQDLVSGAADMSIQMNYITDE